MALARARQAARRVKDKWKAKRPYQVLAPVSFNSHLLAETIADEPEKLLGRKVETTMTELSGDMKQMHIKLSFQVADVHDNKAQTVFVGHAHTSDYVRRLTRRGHTKIPAVFDLRTKDGCRIRVKPFAVTDRRCQTTQAQAIRQIMQDMLTDCAKKNTLAGFLKAILVDDLTTQMYKEARKVHPVRRIEVAKSEILRAPTIEKDETPVLIIEQATEEPEADEGSEGEAVEVVSDSEEEVVDDSEE